MGTVSRRRVTDVVVHAPAGELDLASCGSLRSLLGAAHQPGAHIELDMTLVTFFDTSALDVVLAAAARLRTAGGVLELTHVAGRVLRVLQLCGAAELLTGQAGPRARRGHDRSVPAPGPRLTLLKGPQAPTP